MATVIRFSRHGCKKKPIYRIVVQHNQAPRDGKFIEHIGNFNPIKGDETLVVHRDRLEYWLSVGAQMSDSVRTTLKPKLKEWQASAPMVQKAPKAPKVPKEKKSAAPKKPAASAAKKAAPRKAPEA